MKAIVTGGAGFIGSHVASFLLKGGHEVLVIDDLSGGLLKNIPEGASFIQASINDDLEQTFSDFKPDYVYHLAAYAAEGLSHHIPKFNYENNVVGTVNMLNAAYKAGAKHFVFTSSIAVYGHPHGNEVFDENAVCVPCDPYGIAKLCCEYHIKSFSNYFGGMTYTIFRPHNVFGPNQNISDPYRNVVGIFMAKAIQRVAMPVFGDGSQTRSFSYVNVVAECIALAPFIEGASNEIFNIGSDDLLTVKELAIRISQIFDVPLLIDFLPARKEVDHAHSVHQKARNVFEEAYSRSIDLNNGLKIMAESVAGKSIPPVTECPSPIELFTNLPKSWAARLASHAGQ